MATTLTAREGHDVGGVLLERPFKVRRLGHFGFNVVNIEEALDFYTRLLGFRVSDTIDFSQRAPNPEMLAGLGDPKGYFMHHAGDHHSFVLFNKRVREALDTLRRFAPGITVNQITWQAGSLREVAEATPWLRDHGQTIQRTGRDMPGSNWHTYFYDPDGHTNELYYGIEQIGWNGFTKPKALYKRGFHEPPPLPQIGEQAEVEQAREEGLDLLSGYRYIDEPGRYDVDGIMLPRPFKITGIGPLRLFVQDLDRARGFYQDVLGLLPTEEIVWEGQRCLFFRANTEHHSLALYPIKLRAKLDLSEHTTCMSFGFRLANYTQLRSAIAFLGDQGVRIRELPPELFPGMGHTAFAFDPDGHALQLYAGMEQIGWNGQPRPTHLRPEIGPGNWPDTLSDGLDAYLGEPFLGPLG